MSGARLFLVEDDATLRQVLSNELRDLGHEVEPFPKAEGVLEALADHPPEAIVLDLKLPGVGGMELLRSIRERHPDGQVIILTGHGGVGEAVEAMRLGAHDFLTKPVRLDVLDQAVQRARDKHRLLRENERLMRAVQGVDSTMILGDSPAMIELLRSLERVAQSESGVLILGESGTGKELVARRIHQLSPRAGRPFVVVNCGAIPDALVESELFGHEKGAFTGASRRRMGLFEAAHGGTLFLDELGELPKAVQPALLRAVQFGEIRTVGGEQVGKVDVRVIGAANQSLPEAIRKGLFREDLYFRIATLQLEIPPLRERPGDIELLAKSFLARRCLHDGVERRLNESALALLKSQEWRGNVRELENAIERLSVMSDAAEIGPELVERHARPAGTQARALPTLNLQELERVAIAAALERHAGRKPEAAKALGIGLTTLYSKLERYGLRD